MALLMWFLSPIGRYVGLVVAIAVAGGVVVTMIRRDAAADATRAIERANRTNEDRADAGEQRVLTCPPELWSREKRTCATKLH